jgi:hypothetical protein
MKLALDTCAPLPPKFGFIFAVPITVPSSSVATTVRPGGSSIQMARAWSAVRSTS